MVLDRVIEVSSPPLGLSSVSSSVRHAVRLSVFSRGAGLPLVPIEKAPVAASQSISQCYGIKLE